MKDFESQIKRDLSHIACSDFKSEMSIDYIMSIWHTPKGVELCRNAKYPTPEVFRSFSDIFADYGVFVDSLDKSITNKDCVLYNSVSTLSYKYPSKIYDIVLYDDNVVTIKASDYAVVNVHNLGNSVIIIEKDENSIVNVD